MSLIFELNVRDDKSRVSNQAAIEQVSLQKPLALFTVDDSNRPIFRLDASNSLGNGLIYQWRVEDASNVDLLLNISSNKIVSINLAGQLDGIYNVILNVTDIDGFTSIYSQDIFVGSVITAIAYISESEIGTVISSISIDSLLCPEGLLDANFAMKIVYNNQEFGPYNTAAEVSAANPHVAGSEIFYAYATGTTYEPEEVTVISATSGSQKVKIIWQGTDECGRSFMVESNELTTVVPNVFAAINAYTPTSIDATGSTGIYWRFRLDKGNTGVIDYSSSWLKLADTSTLDFTASGYTIESLDRPYVEVGIYEDNGDLDDDSLIVPITNNPPTANIQTDVLSGEVPFTVNFDASGSTDGDGTIQSYSWDFGDTNSGSGVTTSHEYTVAGNYTVTLTVTDDDSAVDTSTVQITANEPSFVETNLVLNLDIANINSSPVADSSELENAVDGVLTSANGTGVGTSPGGAVSLDSQSWPFIVFDLGQVEKIDRVVLHPRTDNFIEYRIRNVIAYLSTNPFTTTPGTTKATWQTESDAWADNRTQITVNDTKTISFGGVNARYILLTLDDNFFFDFAEIEIFDAE